MELRHLRYFTLVVQWKGYREASRHLYIAQPSISEAVSDLESELGIKLFSRGGCMARLTPEGQVFYEEARRSCSRPARSAGLRSSALSYRLRPRPLALMLRVSKLATCSTSAACFPSLLASRSL
jgi:DNA-binding transcriptional LysR family regulator